MNPNSAACDRDLLSGKLEVVMLRGRGRMRAKITLVMALVVAVLVITAWQTGIAECEVVTDGLVSYWSFDRASIIGKTVKDVWGDTDTIIVGDPEVDIVEGRFGEENITKDNYTILIKR